MELFRFLCIVRILFEKILFRFVNTKSSSDGSCSGSHGARSYSCTMDFPPLPEPHRSILTPRAMLISPMTITASAISVKALRARWSRLFRICAIAGMQQIFRGHMALSSRVKIKMWIVSMFGGTVSSLKKEKLHIRDLSETKTTFPMCSGVRRRFLHFSSTKSCASCSTPCTAKYNLSNSPSSSSLFVHVHTSRCRTQTISLDG